MDHELAEMQNIYNGAAATIAAASASRCDERFLAERSLPETWRNATFQLRYQCFDGTIGEVFLSEYDDLDGYRKPLDQRAWTMQERILSARVLSFSSRKTRWKCVQTAETDGGIPIPIEIGNPSDPEMDALMPYLGNPKSERSKWPLLPDFPAREWEKRLVEYTRRQLSHPTDKLPAIAGLAAAMAGQALPNDPISYLAGLWEYDMPCCLLWARKESTSDNGPYPRPEYRAPNWSWASIEGQITYPGLTGTPQDIFCNRRTFRPESSLEILGSYIEPTSKTVPFGGVNSGVLFIQGLAKKAHWDGSRWFRSIETGQIIIVKSIFDAVEQDTDDVWFVIFGLFHEKPPFLIGLLLMDGGFGGMKRVGRFEYEAAQVERFRREFEEEIGSEDLVDFVKWSTEEELIFSRQLLAAS